MYISVPGKGYKVTESLQALFGKAVSRNPSWLREVTRLQGASPYPDRSIFSRPDIDNIGVSAWVVAVVVSGDLPIELAEQ